MLGNIFIKNTESTRTYIDERVRISCAKDGLLDLAQGNIFRIFRWYERPKHQHQCVQIGRLLKILGGIFSNKSSPNAW